MTMPSEKNNTSLERLRALNEVFAQASVGDFSENIVIPEDDDTFTELYVGVQIMLDVIREKIEAFETIKQQLEGEIGTKNQLLAELREERNNLRQYQSKHEAILSSIGEGMIVTNSRGRIIMINDAATQMLELRADQVVGKTMTRVFILCDAHDQIVPPKAQPMYQALTAGVKISNSDTYYYQRSNSTRFPVAFTATPLLEDQKITGAIFLFRDVSREKEIDDAKNEFISLASHQLRTPLTVIQWYMERLLQGRAGQLSPKQAKYVHEVYQASRRMAALVQSLLNVSRLELGTYTLDEKMIDIAETAHTVVKEFLPSVIQRGQQLVERYAEDLPLIIIDPKVVYMVLQNLIGNAIKYTSLGGTITVKIALQSKSLGAKPDHIIISITDTGLGIPSAQQTEIFKKLFRADNVKELDTDGNGLGLYITKSMLDVAGGKVWFESKEGKGSSFYVLLPLTKSVAPIAPISTSVV